MSKLTLVVLAGLLAAGTAMQTKNEMSSASVEAAEPESSPDLPSFVPQRFGPSRPGHVVMPLRVSPGSGRPRAVVLIPPELSKKIARLDTANREKARIMCSAMLALAQERQTQSEAEFQQQLHEAEAFFDALEVELKERRTTLGARADEFHRATQERIDKALERARTAAKEAADSTRTRLAERQTAFRQQLKELMEESRKLSDKTIESLRQRQEKVSQTKPNGSDREDSGGGSIDAAAVAKLLLLVL